MKKYTFIVLSLVCSANMTHPMQYPFCVYNPGNFTQNMHLHMAVYLGNFTEVESLLNSKVDVNQRDNNGNTPLHIATTKGYTQIVQLLLAHGAQDIINNQSYSPSDIATATRNFTIWRILTEHWIAYMNELL